MVDEHSIKKIRILKLWELLRTETDESCPMDTVTIMERLKKEGLLVDRKTLYRDIDQLNEYGFEVMCIRSNRNRYFVSDRSFDEAEIRMLIDAVFSANFITSKKSEQLATKLTRLACKNSYSSLMRNLNTSVRDKHENEQIWYNVDIINTAIQADKKIRFKYFDYHYDGSRKYRKNGDYYEVNPVGLIFSYGNYYFVGFGDKYSQVANYRVDRMECAEVIDKELLHPAWMKKFDLSKHKNESFSMFFGETVKVQMLVDNSLTDVILDKFGYDINANPYGDNQFYFRTKVQISPVFFQWLVTFGDKIKIIEPVKVRDEYVEFLKKIVDSYSN